MICMHGMHLPRLFALLVALACSRCRGSDFVTIGIKTFERPALLQFCVEQVRLAYPELPLVVADDSSRAVQERNAQTLAVATRAGGGERGEERDGGGASGGGGPITHLALAFDVGLSAGRNRIVERCTTPFVCLFDDSRFVTPQTHVLAMAAFLAESGAHLVGGAVAGRGNRYYAGEFRPPPPPPDDRGGEDVVAVAVDARQQQQPQQQQQQPQRQQLIGVCFREPDDERRRIATATPLARVGGAFETECALDHRTTVTSERWRRPVVTHATSDLSHTGAFETELVLNAFVANASALRASPWDEALKLGEHKA